MGTGQNSNKSSIAGIENVSPKKSPSRRARIDSWLYIAVLLGTCAGVYPCTVGLMHPLAARMTQNVPRQFEFVSTLTFFAPRHQAHLGGKHQRAPINLYLKAHGTRWVTKKIEDRISTNPNLQLTGQGLDPVRDIPRPFPH